MSPEYDMLCVFSLAGFCLGVLGLYLGVIVAPIRGDNWGFIGIALFVVGFPTCVVFTVVVVVIIGGW